MSAGKYRGLLDARKIIHHADISIPKFASASVAMKERASQA